MTIIDQEGELPGVAGRDVEANRRIYRYFVESIKTGKLVAGARIPAERALALQFDASRTTVRKALATLEEDKLIERRLGSGTYVRDHFDAAGHVPNLAASISPLDVLEARLALEPGVAELAVARATEEDFARIEAMIERLETLADGSNDPEFKRHGYLVQREIVRASRNMLLVRMYDMLIQARSEAGWSTLRQLTSTQEARDRHVAVARAQLAAFRARDARRVREIGRELNLRMIQEVIGPTD